MPTKPELIDVDPASLLIGTNVRRDAHADTLVSSLKSNGMLHPIRARRTEDGLEVIDGQRRTLAAIAAGIEVVPVLVVETSDHGRVFEQYVSNEAREALTDVDRIRAIQQLSLFKLNAGTIAKRTGLTKTVVERAISIPDTTLELVPNGTLEDLADLAAIEGEPEHERAAQALAAGNNGYEFRAAISAVGTRKAVEAEAARLRAAHPDLTILDAAPEWGDKRYLRIQDHYMAPKLQRADGTEIPTPIDDFDVALEQLGAAFAVAVTARHGYGDSAALAAIGLFVDAERLEEAGLQRISQTQAASVTPEDRERWERERQEREATAKAWAETAEPRKDFVAGLVQAKQPPTGWADLVLEHSFHGDPDALYSTVTLNAIRQMLGLDQLDLDNEDEWDENGPDALLVELRKRPDRLPFALLAVAIASLEERDLATSHGFRSDRAPAYLDRLEKWGYDAAAERAVIAEAVQA